MDTCYLHASALPCTAEDGKGVRTGPSQPNREGNKAVSPAASDTKRRQRPNVSVLLHQFRVFNVLLFLPALLAPSRQLFRLEADLYSVPFLAVPRRWRGLARKLRDSAASSLISHYTGTYFAYVLVSYFHFLVSHKCRLQYMIRGSFADADWPSLVIVPLQPSTGRWPGIDCRSRRSAGILA